MRNKSLLILGILAFFSVAGSAALRFKWVMPTNQLGQADTYALPCEPKYVASATGAVVPLEALAQAGAVYWVDMGKAATAGDSIVFRDTDTANASSTPFFTAHNASTTGSLHIQFDPPMAFTNGLSVNVSSQTINATVCVREADGGI